MATGAGEYIDIDLGNETQFVLIKNTTNTASWVMVDIMRGMVVGSSNDETLSPDTSNATWANPNHIHPTPKGFRVTSNSSWFNSNGDTYIYMAIRRSMKEPESSSEVFAIDQAPNNNNPRFISEFPVDMSIQKRVTSSGASPDISARLTQGRYMRTGSTNAESTSSTIAEYDFMNGFDDDGDASTEFYAWMFKRAKGFFDVVCYTGDGVAGRTVSHNLGVAPEMMWVKTRDDAEWWAVYSESLGNASGLNLNGEGAIKDGTVPTWWTSTTPTDSVFTVGTASNTNKNTKNMIAYLFATLPGISKVGSYTGNGTSQTIDCGFTTGAKFVLIKSTSVSGDWVLYDSVRGITAGNDPWIKLNDTDAENSGADMIDPDTSGFIVNNETLYGPGANPNRDAVDYIFYSIANPI